MLPIFRGAATALLTPFRPDGSIDLPAWDRLLERQLDAGIAALVVCGTTGEAATLTQDERLTLLRRAKQAACGHCPVIMGVGTNCTAGSVENAELAAQNGADALLAVTPYYNKGTQAGLLAHYTAIADASPLPLVLYNVPSRTGVDLLPETVRALARHPHIAGIKEACGSISRAAQLLARCGLPVWSGNDDQTAAIMALGGSGVISVVSNVAPEAVVAMTDACLAGDFREGARRQLALLPLCEALFCVVNPIPVKAAMEELGLCGGTLRLPLSPLEEPHRSRLRAVLRGYGLLS